MALAIGQMRVAVQAIRDAHEIPSADGAETPPHASQVFDTPGDPKFAPLGDIFLGAVRDPHAAEISRHGRALYTDAVRPFYCFRRTLH